MTQFADSQAWDKIYVNQELYSIIANQLDTRFENRC